MNELKLHLLDEDQWSEVDSVIVRGNAFRKGELLSGDRLAEVFQGPIDKTRFQSIVSTLNGFFTIVVQTDEALFAAVDRWRTYPLFYGISSDGFYLSDDAHWICNSIGDDEINEVAKAEYIRSLFVSGSDTLANNVTQMRSGELIRVPLNNLSSTITTTRYYRFGGRRQKLDCSRDELIQEYEKTLDAVFQRLVEFAAGRPIAVSLSAGPDSRLLALKLAELGYSNLFSFAYTRRGQESIAEDVAASLGINFDHIPISHQEIHDWYHSDERKRFDRHSGMLDAVPNHWVSFAIKKLQQNSSIPSDAIIVTGDGAQTMADHIPSEFLTTDHISKSEFVEGIISNNYFEFDTNSQNNVSLRERILESLDIDLYQDNRVEPADEVINAYEEWDWQERQSKAIRSSYMYEYFDYQFWFPLKDHEYMDFWREVPLKFRQGKSFHDEYVAHRYQEATGEFMVESSFLAIPKWLWVANLTVGKVPLVGPFARQLYRKLFKSDFNYVPEFGMVNERQLNELIDERTNENITLEKLSGRHIHALNITNEYNLES